MSIEENIQEEYCKEKGCSGKAERRASASGISLCMSWQHAADVISLIDSHAWNTISSLLEKRNRSLLGNKCDRQLKSQAKAEELEFAINNGCRMETNQ